MFYKYHGTHLPQRDFDISFTRGNLQIFKKRLLASGFELGKLNTTTSFTVKRKIQNISLIKNGYVYLDVSTDTSYSSSQFNKSDFTIGCFNIPLRKVLNENWIKWTNHLPQGVRDIKNKQLHLHKVGMRSLFRCVRFVDMGFSPPSKTEMLYILKAYNAGDEEILLHNKVKLEQLVQRQKIISICEKLKVPFGYVTL